MHPIQRTYTKSIRFFELASTTNETEITDKLPDYGNTPVEVDEIELPPISKKWIRKDLFGKTLISETLENLESDQDFQKTSKRLNDVGAAAMTKEERTQRRRALEDLGVPDFLTLVSEKKKDKEMLAATTDSDLAESASATETTTTTSSPPKPMKRKSPTLLQVNIGLYCNQACGHCHVESSPLRKTENMASETVARILTLLKNTPSIKTLDITGGAPELNENFRMLVSLARELRPNVSDLEIIDRCNLTVLQEPGQEDLVHFLAKNKVRVVASLPCYSAANVDKQRGNGVFERSISALLTFNQMGYGSDDSSDLKLDLVYNPLGAFLPPDQKKLEMKYKEELLENFGIRFNELFTMTNMPIKRFADFLYRRGELKEYMDLLVRNFNTDTTDTLMCLDTVSIGWDGKVFDCDFNQQLGYGIGTDEIHQGGKTVFDIESYTDLMEEPIKNDNHCFGCTAGMGSS